MEDHSAHLTNRTRGPCTAHPAHPSRSRTLHRLPASMLLAVQRAMPDAIGHSHNRGRRDACEQVPHGLVVHGTATGTAAGREGVCVCALIGDRPILDGSAPMDASASTSGTRRHSPLSSTSSSFFYASSSFHITLASISLLHYITLA